MNKEIPYDVFNKRIFSLVMPGTRVLDIGCSTGRLGEKLRREKNCFVVGVDVNEKALRLAKPRLDKAFKVDLDTDWKLPFEKGDFEVIVLADILEHLKDPEKLLRSLIFYLSEDGFFLLSFPNVGFFSVRLNLLLGKFQYSDHGVMDRNHLRFFTLRTVREMLAAVGFVPTKTIPLNLKSDSWWGDLSWVGYLWKTLFSYQIVVKAERLRRGRRRVFGLGTKLARENSGNRLWRRNFRQKH